MPTSLDTAEKILSQLHYAQLIRAGLVIFIGLVLAKLIGITIKRFGNKYFSKHNTALLKNLAFYSIFIVFSLTALQELGFSLSILLGAAGILTIALGFASQLSVSNLISGLFLIVEKPFQVGDSISVAEVTGEVLAINTLSIKILTSENTLVRIPNETLIKSNIINLSHFSLRKVNLNIGISYNADSEQVKAILLRTAYENIYCVHNPIPVVHLISFADSAVMWQLSVYTKTEDYLLFKSSLQEQVKKALENNNIEIPFPTRTILMHDDKSHEKE